MPSAPRTRTTTPTSIELTEPDSVRESLTARWRPDPPAPPGSDDHDARIPEHSPELLRRPRLVERHGGIRLRNGSQPPTAPAHLRTRSARPFTGIRQPLLGVGSLSDPGFARASRWLNRVIHVWISGARRARGRSCGGAAGAPRPPPQSRCESRFTDAPRGAITAPRGTGQGLGVSRTPLVATPEIDGGEELFLVGGFHVALGVDGEHREVDVEPRRLLVQVVREEFGLTGTHVAATPASAAPAPSTSTAAP